MSWWKSWRERCRRMRWFADELLPELMTAAQMRKAYDTDTTQTVSASAHAAAEPIPPISPAETARSLQKLDEVLRRLPESERERLKNLFTPPR